MMIGREDSRMWPARATQVRRILLWTISAWRGRARSAPGRLPTLRRRTGNRKSECECVSFRRLHLRIACENEMILHSPYGPKRLRADIVRSAPGPHPLAERRADHGECSGMHLPTSAAGRAEFPGWLVPSCSPIAQAQTARAENRPGLHPGPCGFVPLISASNVSNHSADVKCSLSFGAMDKASAAASHGSLNNKRSSSDCGGSDMGIESRLFSDCLIVEFQRIRMCLVHRRWSCRPNRIQGRHDPRRKQVFRPLPMKLATLQAPGLFFD